MQISATVAVTSLLLRPAAAQLFLKTGDVSQVLYNIAPYRALVKTDLIDLKIPDIADNRNSVPVNILSRVENAGWLAVLAPQNPQSLISAYQVQNGSNTQIGSRIKLFQTSVVMVAAFDGMDWLYIEKLVKVTTTDCGG